MARTIMLAATLPAPPDRLYEMYLDAETHSAFTGHPVTIAAQPGAPFEAFDKVLSGTVLHVEPKQSIVQTWRSKFWPQEAKDSLLLLTFSREGEEGRVEVVHVNVPEEDFAGVSQGWEKHYWTPWRADRMWAG